MKEKVKYLFKNAGYLLIGNFSSKILVFFLVPLYTSILSTTEYGIYDLAYTTIQLIVPILSLNIIDAIMRFTIDASQAERHYTFLTALKCLCIAVLVFSVCLLILALIPVDIVRDYWLELLLFFISYVFCQFTIQFSRGLDDIKGISIAGILGTVSVISCNLLFLVVFKMGLIGYFWANTLSFMVQGFFLFLHSHMHQYMSVPNTNEKDGKQYSLDMIRYAFPLIFNTLSWYVNSAADRYAVTFFCGIAENGIYSVSYKIPAILNALQTIFIQAWQLSAIKEFESTDRDLFYKKTYQSVQGTMIVLCSFLICFSKLISRLMFSADFYAAWRYVPTLLTYVVFNTLSGTIGGIFSAAKDARAFSFSALVGVSVNLVLNIVFVYLWGAEGAAIATVISSITIWRMRMHFAKKYVTLSLSERRYLFEYFLLFTQTVLISVFDGLWVYGVVVTLFVVLLAMNFKEAKGVLNRAHVLS